MYKVSQVEKSFLTAETGRNLPFNLQTLKVALTDYQFATSTGATQPYGQAHHCRCDGDFNGTSMVDFSGTEFFIDHTKVVYHMA